MKPFTVDDIKDIFKADLDSFISSTRRQLDRYLSPEGAVEDFEECARHAHSMKGVAAMVHAWGLSHFGDDLECLYELAESLHNSERERARGIAGFIHALIPHWEEMAEMTLDNRLEAALEVYRKIRGLADKHYNGYLPKRELTEISFGKSEARVDDSEKVKPASAAAGVARKVAMPGLKVVSVEAVVSDPAQMKPSAEAAGVARRISQPRFKTTEDRVDEHPAAANESVKPSIDTAGVARNVAKPMMKVADEPSPVVVAEEEVQSLKLLDEAMEQAATAFCPVDEDLVALFRGEASEYIESLGMSLGQLRTRDGDETWSEVRRLCHTIKGSAAMVGLDEASERAKHAENLARSGEENKNARGTRQVAKLIQAVEQCAKTLGLSFKLIAPSEVPKSASKVSTPAIDKDLAQAFVLDANDQLETLENALLLWEKGDDIEEHRNAAYRAYHTLKGAANSIGLGPVGAQIHHVEALLDFSRQGGVTLQKEMFTFLLTTVDHLRKFSAELNTNAGAVWTFEWAQTVAALVGASLEQSQAKAGQRDEKDFEAEIVHAFALDARDQAQHLEQAVLNWERNNEPADQIQAAYRAFHTLRGAANSIGFKRLGDNFHVIESLLDRISKSGQLQPPAEIITFFLGSVDDLTKFATELERNPNAAWPHDWQAEAERLSALLGDAGENAQPIAEEIDATPAQTDYIRVEANRIRKLLNQVGEQVVERNRFGAKLERAIQLRQLLGGNRQRLIRLVENFQDQFEYSSARVRSGGAAMRGAGFLPPPSSAGESGTDEFSELEFDRYDEYNMFSRQLTEVADDLGQVTVELERLIESFRYDEQRFASNSKLMQRDITTLTSQPIEGLFRRLDRIFRDAVQAEQKDAALRFEGISATLDRSVIERLYTPLLHLVRNAVAHGIEAPEAREAAGKPRQGIVIVGATQSSNQIFITIRDDGSGVDPARVLARAKERGLISADTTELSPERTLEMLFTPGFSTAAEVTSLAGRGVGLDVVKKEIESINGSVTMETEVGKGTTWRLQLPLTLAVSEAVIVGIGSQEFAIPLNFVASGLLLKADEIFLRDGTEFYSIAGEDIRLIRLARLFGGEDEISNPRGVILSVGDQRCVLLVDRVPARREIVVKGFDPLLARHIFLEGATLDSDGRPVLILSAPALIRYASVVARMDAAKPALSVSDSSLAARKVEQRSGRLVALVVDDSLSVRTVQDRLLAELGLEVVLANDGLDALDKLRQRTVDIIFTDLEMPRMNGYDLISTVRSNANWAHIPMVLVTSRSGQKHLDKAKDLGCNGFLIKPFTQADLAAQLSEHARYESRAAVLK